MRYEVWLEGYWCEPECEGKPHTAEYLGSYEADNFVNACRIAAMVRARGDMYMFHYHYSINDNTWWGRRFFDNEEDARKAFG